MLKLIIDDARKEMQIERNGVIDPSMLFLYIPQQQRPRQSRLQPGAHVAQPDQPFANYLNRYWESLTRVEAEQVYQLYRQAHDVLGTDGTSQLTAEEKLVKLQAIITQLYAFHRVDRVASWISMNAPEIRPSSDTQRTFIQDEQGINTPEKTYNYHDYARLLALSLSLRFIRPIWDSLVLVDRPVGKSDRANKRFTGLEYVWLLEDTGVLEDSAVERLRVYLGNMIPPPNVADEKFNSRPLYMGISTVDAPDFQLGELLHFLTTNKALLVPSVVEDREEHLVKAVYSRVRTLSSQFQIQDQMGSAGAEMYRCRTHGANTKGDDGTEKGYWENSARVASELPVAATVLVRYDYHDFQRCARSMRIIQPHSDQAVLQEFMQQLQSIEGYMPDPTQQTVMSWVLGEVTDPRGILHLPRVELINAMATACSVLWCSGFKYLAALLSAKLHPDGVLDGSDVAMRKAIDPDLLERIEQLYPVQFHTQSTKQPKVGQVRPPKPKPVQVKIIDPVSTHFITNQWWSNLPARFNVELFGYATRRRIRIQDDTREQFARLIIAVGEGKFPTV